MGRLWRAGNLRRRWQGCHPLQAAGAAGCGPAEERADARHPRVNLSLTLFCQVAGMQISAANLIAAQQAAQAALAAKQAARTAAAAPAFSLKDFNTAPVQAS